jgi:hypothetical protein
VARRDAPTEADLAALGALGLGALAAVLMVAGHQPWDGPQVAAVTATHGVHVGDALAIGPLAGGVALARWCRRRGRGTT